MIQPTLLIAALAVQLAPELEIEPYQFVTANGTRVEAELGTLRVPARHSDPDGKQFKLRFVRFESTNPEPGAPIVYLAGGPGGSGIATARGTRFPLFMALREIADVIAFDQRGTGMSDRPPAFRRGWRAPTNRLVTREELHEIAAEHASRAAEFWVSRGIDLEAYTTVESADDLEALRRALGAPKLSLWGISYGTHLAISAMRRHPNTIDRVILAGVEGPGHTVKRPRDQQVQLERIAARVAADPIASARYPDFLSELQAVLAAVEANPVRIGGVVIGKLDIQRLVARALRGPSTSRMIPAGVYALSAGDFSIVAKDLPSLRSGGISAMPGAMDAASGVTAERRALIEAEVTTTLIGDAINFPDAAVREGLGVADLGDEFRAPLESSIPSLLISGTLDGRTSVANAHELAEGLSDVRHLILDGAGHSDPLFLSSPEILTTMLRFLRGETVDDRTIELPPIKFLPDDEPDDPAPRIALSPSDPVILGDPVSIELTGLPPNRLVEVVASSSGDGARYESTATFRSDAAGRVDVTGAAPIEGSYSGVDPMGLFWSMRPTRKDSSPPLADRSVVTIEAHVDGEVVHSVEHHRWLEHPRVDSRPVRDHGMLATFYDPGLGEARPGIVVVGGSGGGIGWQELMGQLLASHGYAVLALAYFRVDPLPKMLEEIPLEYFDRAFDWLVEQPAVDAKRLAVIGYSKGAELALLLGATFPRIRAVVSFSGSGTVFVAPRAGEPYSSWSYRGKPVTYAPIPRVPDRKVMAESYLAALKNEAAVAAARIPVENTKGAILLLSGKSDRSWPATAMSAEVERALREADHPYPFRHESYGQAGHEIHLPGAIPTVSDRGIGETDAGTARARRLAWATMLEFLKAIPDQP